jgi:hypothetical protein
MNNKRLELHDVFRVIMNITESDGDDHVYFQPPESVKMKYPAIVYSLDDAKTDRANDRIYNIKRGYSVTLIDKNPDSGYFDKILEIPHCKFNTSYPADNLNHFNFTIYY